MQSIHNNLSAGPQDVNYACRRYRHGAVDKKETAMVQWVNRLRNNIFVNPPPLPLLCEISGALHLAQLGLTAGRLAGRQNTGEF